jgi:hypothetical protein
MSPFNLAFGRSVPLRPGSVKSEPFPVRHKLKLGRSAAGAQHTSTFVLVAMKHDHATRGHFLDEAFVVTIGVAAVRVRSCEAKIMCC